VANTSPWESTNQYVFSTYLSTLFKLKEYKIAFFGGDPWVRLPLLSTQIVSRKE
jgi:hypothetical protein